MIRIAAALVLCALSNVVLADPGNVVLPPGSKVDARDPEALSIAWWQWAMSVPDPVNPVRDLTGANCAVGQEGKVWFLAGGFGSSKIRRKCRVPKERYFFFPIINTVYWRARDQTDLSCKAAKAAAAVNNESALELFVEVDGVSLQDPKRYRAKTSNCFDIYARVPRKLGGYRAYPSASDGYWVLLAPLAKGTHIIKFGGRYNVPGNAYGRMVQDIEYEIEVVESINPAVQQTRSRDPRQLSPAAKL
jgi:hypothetical protein